MTVLNIIRYPDKLLRRKGRYVDEVTRPKVQRDVDDMLETLAASGEHCAALASTQLAIDDPYNMVVLNSLPGGEEIFNGKPLVLINPRLVTSGHMIKGPEGCMSIAPERAHADVERFSDVEVTAMDRLGNTLHFSAKDFFARCLQHECDHLKGKLYIDYLSADERKALERTIGCA